jgi:hypothetical protein
VLGSRVLLGRRERAVRYGVRVQTGACVHENEIYDNEASVARRACIGMGECSEVLILARGADRADVRGCLECSRRVGSCCWVVYVL